MFAALLTEMQAMNSNFSSFCNPEEDGVPEGEDDDVQNDQAKTSADDTDANVENLLRHSAPVAGTSQESDVLQDIAQDLNVNERTDPVIHEGLAVIFNALLREKMSDDKLKGKKDKYVRPENVANLRIPKVNPLVWNQLSSPMRTQDAKSQKAQSILTGLVIASIKAADLAVKKYGGDRELITLLTDSIAMGLQYNHEVNQSRRMAMKRELHKDYAALCNVSSVEGDSEFLFGDLSKLTKDIAEANKLTKRVRPTQQFNYNARGDRFNHGRASYSAAGNRRFHPYDKNRSNFLNRGHPSKFKKKKEGTNNHQ
jgi:hypothetical protein